MELDELLLGQIRQGSRELWRGFRSRLGRRLILAALFVLLGVSGSLWLLGALVAGPLARGAAVKVGAILAAFAGIFGDLCFAWADAAYALVVTGPLLRSLGDTLLISRPGFGARELETPFARFGSPERLAHAMRVRDLPLLLFLGRAVLGLDLKPLLEAAETGLGREELVGELERLGRGRAARLLRRLRTVAWLCLVFSILLPLLIAGLYR